MKKSQRDWAIEQLLNNGEVTRNGALQNFITRLGAIICDLNKEEGWEVVGKWRKEGNKKDFVYFLRKTPYVRKTYTFSDGTIVSKLVKR